MRLRRKKRNRSENEVQVEGRRLSAETEANLAALRNAAKKLDGTAAKMALATARLQGDTSD